MRSIRVCFKSIGITSHRLFLAAIIFKAIDGVLEIASGILVLSLGTAAVKHLIARWTGNELAEEPGNLFARYFSAVGQNLTLRSTLFAAIYLLAHGAVKLGLVIGMLKKVRWAYPAAAVTIGLFIAYQIYRLFVHFSYSLLLLTGIDAIIIVLIVLEYRRLRRLPPPPPTVHE